MTASSDGVAQTFDLLNRMTGWTDRTRAVADGKTNYGPMNVGEGFSDKFRRHVYGFNINGSQHNPVPSARVSYFTRFYGK
jgi:hypothetical protein